MEIQNIEALMKEFNHLIKCKEYLVRLISCFSPHDTKIAGGYLIETNGRNLIRDIYEELYDSGHNE